VTRKRKVAPVRAWALANAAGIWMVRMEKHDLYFHQSSGSVVIPVIIRPIATKRRRGK